MPFTLPRVAALALLLAACGGKVVFDPQATSSSTGTGGSAASTPPSACAAACEDAHPEGLGYYEVVLSTCVCDSCSESCSQSVCDDKTTPTEECLPCVQSSLSGDACNLHAGLFGSGCLGYEDCTALVECLVQCGS